MNRNLRYRLLSTAIIFVMVLSLWCGVIPAYAASPVTRYVITEVRHDPVECNVIGNVYSYKYKKGLIRKITIKPMISYGSEPSYETFSYNKKGQYVKHDGSKLKRNRKGRVVRDGIISYKYNPKGLCVKTTIKMHYGNEIIKYSYNSKRRMVKSGPDRFYYDKRGNINKAKWGGGSAEVYYNTYSGKRLVQCVCGNTVLTFKYKKVKVPAKFAKKVSRQQAWIRNQSIVSVMPDLVTIN